MPAKKAAKKATKKAAKKSVVKKSSKKKPKSTVWIGVAVAIVALILLAVVLFKADTDSPQRTVRVSVNGEPIYADDIVSQYSALPAALQQQYTQEVILEETIKKLLVLQEAEREGIMVTEAEVDIRVEELTAGIGLSQEQIENLLSAQNVTLEEFRTSIKEEIVLNKYVEEVILADITVSDSEIEAYYQLNIGQFTAPENGIRVRHILVENEDDAWEILGDALDGSSFSTLAQVNSLDAASGDQGGDLGFITQDSPLVEPFKEAAFELAVGDVSDPVESTFGWHIIKREPDVMPIRDVRDSIEESLIQEEGRDIFLSRLDELREQAEIVYFE